MYLQDGETTADHGMHKGAESATLSDVIHDALRFAMWAGTGIQEAPLQVYYSALVFAPAQSIVRQQFREEMLGGVRVRLGLKEEWGSLLHTLEGHTNVVTSVVFSAEGDRLASASTDKTVRVWDAKTGQPLHTLEGHTEYVNSVVFSAEGDRLASASGDKTVRVWDVKTGQPLHTLEGHTDQVTSVAFSTEGDRLASTSDDKTVRVWDAKIGQLLHTLEGHTDYVTSVAFSTEGDRLASASDDKTVRVWDAKTGQLLHTLEGHTDYVTSIAFSAEGDRLASASGDKTVRVWDAKIGQPLHTFERVGRVSSMAFSRDSSRLITNNGTLLLLRPALSSPTPLPQAPVKTIFVTERWLTLNTEDIIWIPADNQPRHITVNSCYIAFGYSSGRVLLLEII
jgi:uncharacterized protein with WD repeat